MELTVYSQAGAIKATISPSDASYHAKEVMGENELSLSFTLYGYVALDVNDYVDFEGERFWLLERYHPFKRSTVEWSYSLKLYGVQSLIKRALCLKVVDGEMNPVFSLTAPAVEHVNLILYNVNRVLGVNTFIRGEVPATASITLDYSGTYCHEALNMVAEACKTEWWFDDTTLNLTRCSYGTPFSLGYQNGLLSIEKQDQDNVKFFTRLFPIGSARNVDAARYGASRLHLPGNAKYVEQNTHYGVVEHFEEAAFADIYPRRVGTVSQVRSQEATGSDGNKFTIYYVKDSALGFNPNSYEIPGLVKNMVFQSGELNGRNFEVNYSSATGEFEVITQFPYDNMQLPGGLLVPAIGDTYILWNIRMPDEYYPLAEAELQEAVVRYMQEYSYDTAVYKAPTDYIDCATRALNLAIGQRVRLESAEYFAATGYRDSRITKVTRRVNNPYLADVEISDMLGKGKIAQLEGGVTVAQGYASRALASLPEIIKSYEHIQGNDSNLYSAKKSEKQHLSRLNPDRAAGKIVFEDGAEFGDYLDGVAGAGASVDRHGNGELNSLRVRRFIEVPELRYNRVQVQVGDRWQAPGCGIVESVDTASCILTLKLEDGEIGAAAVDDICMGIFHSTTQSDNSAADSDDSRGNRTFAGFFTAYFRIAEVMDERRRQLRYELRPVSSAYPRQLHPCPAMAFVAYGSFSNPERMASRYATRTYERYLVGVNTWEFSKANVAAQFGELDNLSVFGMQLSGHSAYLNNVYATGKIVVGAGSAGLANLQEWTSAAQDIQEAQAAANAADRKALEASTAAQGALNEAGQATAKVDGLQFGGRNYLRNSASAVTINHTAAGDNYDYYEDKTCYLEANVQYIVKGICPNGLVWSNSHGNISSNKAVLWLRGSDGSHYIISDDYTGTTGTVFTVPTSHIYTLRTNVYKAGQYTFRNIAISRGNKAGDWVLAIEDTQAEIDAAANTAQNTANSANWIANATASKGNSMVPALDYWVLNNQAIVSITDGKEGNTALRISTFNSWYPNAGIYIPIDTFRTYRVRFWARSSADCNGILYFSLRQFKDKGATACASNGGRDPYYPSGVPAHTEWRLYEHDWQGTNWQAGVKYVLPEFLSNYNSTAGYWDIQGFAMYDITDVAKVQASAIEALARTQGLSGIEGGLMFTNILKLMNIGGQCTAGMSGIQKDASGNSLPSFWSGGDYNDAVSGMANLIFKHNGTAKFGNLDIEPSGVATIKDATGVVRVLLTKGNISSLDDLLGSNASGSVNNAAYSRNGSVDDIGEYTLPNSINVTKDNSSVRIVTRMRASVQSYGVEIGGAGGGGRAIMWLWLVNTVTADEMLVDSAQAMAYGGSDFDDVSVDKNMVVSAGTYALKVGWRNIVDPQGGDLACSIKTSTLSYEFIANIARTEVGKNGLCTMWDKNNFFYAAYVNGKLLIKYKSPGLDVPGVLISGRVNADGTIDFTKLWGPKSAGCTGQRIANGVYRVKHNIGHRKHTGTANACALAGTGYIVAVSTTDETETYTEFKIWNDRVGQNLPFNFTICGEN